MIKAELKNITKGFKETIAVKSLSLDIKNGETLVILGPSGCGKSTLLGLMSGIERPDMGMMDVSGRRLFSEPEGIFVPPEKRNIALMFQCYALWPHMTVFQNIGYPLKMRRMKKEKIRYHVEQMLHLTEMEGKGARYPHELSGGEQQRVAFARAIVMKPEILLLDEPLSSLDTRLREEMQQEIKRIGQDSGLTIVHVTHNKYEAMSIADRIAIMNRGRLVQIGTPDDVLNNPATPFVEDFLYGRRKCCKKRYVPGGMEFELPYRFNMSKVPSNTN